MRENKIAKILGNIVGVILTLCALAIIIAVTAKIIIWIL